MWIRLRDAASPIFPRIDGDVFNDGVFVEVPAVNVPGVKILGVPQQFVRVDGMIFADVDPIRFDAVSDRDEESDRFVRPMVSVS